MGAQLKYDASPGTSVVVAYMGGPEQPGNDVNIRHTVDAWASSTAGRATFAMNYGYGREEQVPLAETAGGGVRDAKWQGIAGYVRCEVWSRLAATIRGEWFDDPVGARTGYAQSLTEVTITPEFRVHRRLVVRSDLRRDQSSQAVFEHADGTFGRTQMTLSLNTLIVF